MWNNRSAILSVIHIFPDHPVEERMIFYSCGAALDVTESFGAVNGTERADYVFGSRGDDGFGWEVDGFGYDSREG
jgi:hypothetical protein